jgi:hypothetical protein
MRMSGSMLMADCGLQHCMDACCGINGSLLLLIALRDLSVLQIGCNPTAKLTLARLMPFQASWHMLCAAR